MVAKSLGEKINCSMNDPSVHELFDVISLDEYNLLRHRVLSSNFPWFFYPGTILPTDIERQNNCVVLSGINPPQFSHFVNLKDYPDLPIITPVLNQLSNFYGQDIKLLKCKFNLLTKNIDSTYHYPHADIDDFNNKVYTAIYYIGENDGDTYLFNEFAPKINNNVTVLKTIKPEHNKLAIFDARRFHASSGPNTLDRRVVLNVVFML